MALDIIGELINEGVVKAYLDFDAGDKLAIADPSGDHSLTKFTGVV